MGITEGTVNQFSDVDNIGSYYRNSLKFFSNNNNKRLAMESGGHFRPSSNNVCDRYNSVTLEKYIHQRLTII